MTNLPRVRAVLRAGLITLVLLAATTLLVWALEQVLGLSDASPAYLLTVTAAAVLVGTLPAIGAAVGSFLAYNYLFTEPRFTLVVADTAQLLNLVLLLVVGVVVGQLAGAQRARAEEAERRERVARVLFEVSRALASRSTTQPALEDIGRILEAGGGFARVWFGAGETPGVERALTTAPDGWDARAPHVALQRSAAPEATRWMRVLPASVGGMARRQGASYRVPIEGGGRILGSIWASLEPGLHEPSRDETRMLGSAADQVGLALEQDRLRHEATSAELARESEALKSALLESVSHDLRTPLAAIRAAAGALLEDSGDPAPSASAIDAEAERMDRLVSNLLEISRIEAGGLVVDIQPYPLADLVDASLRRLAAPGVLRVEADVPTELPLVGVDAILLDQALTNVIENALRYAPGAGMSVIARADEAGVRLSIDDAGAGVPDEALPRLFEKFFRVRQPREGARHGTGLGLAVVRGLLRAMGGDAVAARSPLGGLSVQLILPLAELPAEEPGQAV